MAYSIELEARIDTRIQTLDMHMRKKPMFGGLAYFAKGGNMAFAIRGNELLFRTHDSQDQDMLNRAGLHIAVMGNRMMQNWLQAGDAAIADNESLSELLTIGYDYALSLPAKH